MGILISLSQINKACDHLLPTKTIKLRRWPWGIDSVAYNHNRPLCNGKLKEIPLGGYVEEQRHTIEPCQKPGCENLGRKGVTKRRLNVMIPAAMNPRQLQCVLNRFKSRTSTPSRPEEEISTGLFLVRHSQCGPNGCGPTKTRTLNRAHHRGYLQT